MQLVEGSTVLGSAVATGGNWTITSSTLPAGVHSVFAHAVDAAGNQGNTATLTFTIDLTPPAAPSTPDLTAASDSGASNTDNLTNVTTPTFSGTSEAGATITLLEGTTTRGTATADSLGNWTVTSSAWAAGAHSLTARATDVAGNVGGTSAALSITIDTTPPAISPPDMTAASDSGLSSTDNITNIASPTFTGTAEAGSLVELLDGSTVVGSATATTGNWSITASSLSEGVHSLTARATDAAGNQATSAALSVTIDTTNPAISDPDLTAASDSGVSNSDNLTNVKTPVFTGTAEAGSTVSLMEGSTVLGDRDSHGRQLDDYLRVARRRPARSLCQSHRRGGQSGDFKRIDRDDRHVVALRAVGSRSRRRQRQRFVEQRQPHEHHHAHFQRHGGCECHDHAARRQLRHWAARRPTALVIGRSLPARWPPDRTILRLGPPMRRATRAPPRRRLSVTIDTTAPSVSTPLLLPADDTGASNTDRITNINTPMLTGTAEAGTFIELFDGSTLVGTTTTATGGPVVVSWTITSSALTDGVHMLTARGTDAAGNVEHFVGAANDHDRHACRRRFPPRPIWIPPATRAIPTPII